MFKSDLANLLLIVLFAAVIYLHALPGPFHFDDFPHIVDNPHIKSFSNPGAIWDHWPSRFFGFLTLAGNYSLGRLNTSGYRLFNLGIHSLGAVFAYLLAGILVSLAGGDSARSRTAAFWTALVFACHPVQTQAVTYIVQRFASLAGVFTLGSVFCYLRARAEIASGAKFRSLRHLGIYGAGLLLAVLAMTSKESAVVIPVLVLLLDFLFPARDFSGFRRIRYLVPYLLTGILVPGLALYMASGRGSTTLYYSLNLAASAGTRLYILAQDVVLESRYEYILTQLHALLVYFRLIVIPVRQSVWYDLPISRSIFSPAPFFSLLVVSALVITAFRMFRSRLLVSAAIAWFFLTLAPTSWLAVIWPFLAEHHLYLSLFGWALIAGAGLAALSVRFGRQRLLLPAWLLVLFLALLTGRRNHLWGDTYRLWEDALRTAPGSPAIHTAMAGALVRDGRPGDAIEPALRAIEINPRIDSSYHNLWAAYFNLGRMDDAEETSRLYVEEFPDKARPYIALGMTLLKKGETGGARESLEQAVEKDPANMPARYWLGVALYETGADQEAREQMETALSLNPDFPAVYDYLARIYERLGEGEKALEVLSRGADRFPGLLLLNYNRAMLSWRLGDLAAAEKYLVGCLRLPGDDNMVTMINSALSELRSQMSP